MLSQLRHHIINRLWEKYCQTTAEAAHICQSLALIQPGPLTLDHFAIIDLPSQQSGISTLKKLFNMLGYIEQGHDYLPAKQNDFLWLAEEDSCNKLATETLPQIVVADFRLEALPPEIHRIIKKYAEQSKPAPLAQVESLIDNHRIHPSSKLKMISNLILDYLNGRDWPIPALHEYRAVHEFNELLAWVLVFGRRPNHFTLGVHLLNNFENLNSFNQYLTEELNMTLNNDGGVIKGGRKTGIAQSSTKGVLQTIAMADGNIEIPTSFMEFVWRYPININKKPVLWNDYFTGFVAQHADHVIESLYINAAAN